MLIKKGGFGYLVMVLDDFDVFLSFLIDVLDLEFWVDRYWEISEGLVLGLELGILFCFFLVYVKGVGYNYLLFLDYEDGKFEFFNVVLWIFN